MNYFHNTARNIDFLGVLVSYRNGSTASSDMFNHTEFFFQNESAVQYFIGFLALTIFLCFGVAVAYLFKKTLSHKARLIEEGGLIAGLLYAVESKGAREEVLKKELSTKTRSLTMLLLYLILKDQMLAMVRKEVVKFCDASDDEVSAGQSKLASKFTLSINIEKNWEFLKEDFETMNLDFLDRLSAKFSNLTPSDLKLCSLLKNKITPKEIANSMEISRDSAKIAKHRLKRKLGLSTEENLDEFLQLFDQDESGNDNYNKQSMVVDQ
jgi:DNA-binding CsgD family transcriptional regulator